MHMLAICWWLKTIFCAWIFLTVLTHFRIVWTTWSIGLELGNAVLHGVPTYTIRKLQCVQNNAARIVLQAPRRSHATPLQNTLHWLPVQQRIDYKVALLTFKVRSTFLYGTLASRVVDDGRLNRLHKTTKCRLISHAIRTLINGNCVFSLLPKSAILSW